MHCVKDPFQAFCGQFLPLCSKSSSPQMDVPLGPFCRLKRTCTRLQDHDAQSVILRKKFLEKGYVISDIVGAYEKYRKEYNVEGKAITGVSGKHTDKLNSQQHRVAFCTRFNQKAFVIGSHASMVSLLPGRGAQAGSTRYSTIVIFTNVLPNVLPNVVPNWSCAPSMKLMYAALQHCQ